MQFGDKYAFEKLCRSKKPDGGVVIVVVVVDDYLETLLYIINGCY